MRMSRKRRRRFEKDAEPAETAECPASSFRMTRKRLRKWRGSRSDMSALPASLNSLVTFRMTRKRLRQRREAGKPSVAGAMSMSLLFATSGLGEASSLSTLHEVPSEFQALRNAREKIINYRDAERSLRNAQENLRSAKQGLENARQDREAANEGLLQARLNLVAAKANLENIRTSLMAAQAESEYRTQLALASQQAVAEYQPSIYAQEASVEQLSAEEASLAGEYAAKYETAAGQVDELAERIEKAWESVDWQQNRIAEVQALLAGAEGGPPDSSAAEFYTSRLEEISDELERENSFLDEMYTYLEELQAAQEQAEEAEEEARELVRELTEQQAEAETDLAQSQQDLTETEKWQAEAEKANTQAEKELEVAERDLRKASYDFEHLGEGSSFQSSLEYYSWKGAQHGHQLVLGQEFYSSKKKYDFSVGFGYVISRSGHQDGNGQVSGMTDTQLAVTLKNDHKVNDVHYHLGINVPTGKEAHVNAQITEGLAKYTSFNNGFIFTPAVEVIHHFNEKESISGKLSYSFRGHYNVKNTDSDGRQIRERISPGDQLTPEIAYLYAGEKDQYTIKGGFVHNGSTSQYGTSTSEYRDGNSVWLRWFYNHDINPRDSLQVYASYSHEGKASFYDQSYRPYNDSLNWHEFGLGWKHKWEHGQYLQLMLNYQKAKGNLYRYSTRGNESEENYLFSPRRLSATLIYGQKLREHEELELRLERYVLSERNHRGYNGWGLALMYNYSF